MTQFKVNPVFVVGSYRSGTSIFCWCLGQHPNLVNLPETNWVGRLTVDIDNLYRLGTTNREFSHLEQISLNIEGFYRLFGEGVDHFMQATNPTLIENEEQTQGAFQRRRSPDDPKRRWVDATPEYSHYIYGLSLLFPEARFIHLLRNPHDVARSLMKFTRAGGRRDHGHEEAYHNWIRLTQAAYLGERALGRVRMLRVRYEEFIGTPEKVFRQVLEFIGEPYCVDCQEPLDTKINSSHVEPATLKMREYSKAANDATHLYQHILSEPEPSLQGDPAAQETLKHTFQAYCRKLQSPPLYKELSALARLVGRLKHWI